jgi:hypothetical protein
MSKYDTAEAVLASSETKFAKKAQLCANFGYTSKRADELLATDQPVVRTDFVKLVAFVRANKTVARRKLAKMCEEQGLCKESSAFHYLSFQNYVDEYVKQEIADMKPATKK